MINCFRSKEITKEIYKFKDIFINFETTEGYCDMMPSGHMNIVIISIWHLLRIFSISKIGWIIGILFAFIYGLLIMTLRAHYSIDIWMSMVIAPLICSKFGY